MEKYPYQPLNSRSGQIRLLHLLPKRTDSTTTQGRSDEVWKHTSSDRSASVSFNESIDKVRDNDGQLNKQSGSLQTCLGRLETVSVESRPRYTALSYVWGDSSDKVPFILDNYHLLITRNLALALQSLQLDDEPFVLWIDAMCINQDDLKEKSEQVLNMKEIYASASLVIVWLGAATRATDIAMDMFNMFDEEEASLDMTGGYTYRSYDKQRRDLIERDPQFNNFIESEGISVMFSAVQHLMIREWWYRAWVLQEFCVGRKVNFACGSKRLSLALFDNMIMTLNVIENISTSHVLHIEGQWLGASNQNKPKSLSEKADMTYVRHAIDFLRQRLFHQHSLDQKKRSLLDLLVTFYVNLRPRAILRSTDPRDKIYGLLGIASDAEQLKIAPDYSKSITEAYTEAATKILSLGKLELLQYVHPQNPNMPSWVPDWEQPVRHLTPYDCRELDKPFSADATMPALHPRQIPGDLSVLECHGCTVDSVFSFSDFLTDDTTKALRAVAEMLFNKEARGKFDALSTLYVHFSQIKQLCQRSAQINPSLYGPSNTWLNEALWRIPVADQEVVDTYSPHFQRATSESERRYNGLLNMIEAWESIGAKLKDADPRALPAFFDTNVVPIIQRNLIFDALYSPAVDRTVSKRPYLTQKGYVGLGHEGMRIGDSVCILQGGPVPFLLRKTERGDYVLVSDTYVHGIMDGEFMKTKPELEVFRLK